MNKKVKSVEISSEMWYYKDFDPIVDQESS